MENNQLFNAPTDNNEGSGNSRGQQARADGFINSMHILDKNGKEHYINGYVPLSKNKDQLQRSLIAAVENCGDDYVEVTIKARVSLARVDDGSLLDF